MFTKGSSENSVFVFLISLAVFFLSIYLLSSSVFALPYDLTEENQVPLNMEVADADYIAEGGTSAPYKVMMKNLANNTYSIIYTDTPMETNVVYTGSNAVNLIYTGDGKYFSLSNPTPNSLDFSGLEFPYLMSMTAGSTILSGAQAKTIVWSNYNILDPNGDIFYGQMVIPSIDHEANGFDLQSFKEMAYKNGLFVKGVTFTDGVDKYIQYFATDQMDLNGDVILNNQLFDFISTEGRAYYQVVSGYKYRLGHFGIVHDQFDDYTQWPMNDKGHNVEFRFKYTDETASPEDTSVEVVTGLGDSIEFTKYTYNYYIMDDWNDVYSNGETFYKDLVKDTINTIYLRPIEDLDVQMGMFEMVVTTRNLNIFVLSDLDITITDSSDSFLNVDNITSAYREEEGLVKYNIRKQLRIGETYTYTINYPDRSDTFSVTPMPVGPNMSTGEIDVIGIGDNSEWWKDIGGHVLTFLGLLLTMVDALYKFTGGFFTVVMKFFVYTPPWISGPVILAMSFSIYKVATRR